MLGEVDLETCLSREHAQQAIVLHDEREAHLVEQLKSHLVDRHVEVQRQAVADEDGGSDFAGADGGEGGRGISLPVLIN